MNRLVFRLLSSPFGARYELRTLLRQTADAFGVEEPKVSGLSAQELSKSYAQLTTDAAERALQNGEDLEALHQKLYNMTYNLGSRVRWWLRPKNDQECLDIIVLLYRNIGITISGAQTGEFCVHACYFSSFYTPEICSVISAIDQGIFAGIYQRGNLMFRERITEGHAVCTECI